MEDTEEIEVEEDIPEEEWEKLVAEAKEAGNNEEVN